MENTSYDWIVGICSSGADGVSLQRFRGTKDDVKKLLVSLVLKDKETDETEGFEIWEYGTESIDDVSDETGCGWEFYAYGCYSDYHIDYTAREFSHIVDLTLQKAN